MRFPPCFFELAPDIKFKVASARRWSSILYVFCDSLLTYSHNSMDEGCLYLRSESL